MNQVWTSNSGATVVGVVIQYRTPDRSAPGRSKGPSSVFFKITLNYAAGKQLAMCGADSMLFFSALAFGDFFAVDADIDGCLDADANLRAVDSHYGHFNVVANA